MKSSNRILCIVAHPDDEALGVGGTLIKHSEKGDEVYIAILSEGEDSKQKMQEKNPARNLNAKAWSQFADCELYATLDFPDQRLDTVPELDIVKKLEDFVRNISPNIVYTHSLSDINKDHQVVASATLAAIRPISSHKVNPEIRGFETPSSTDQAPMIGQYIFRPNLYVDITNQWSKKLKGLKIYQDELRDFPHARSIKAIEALAIKRGSESGLELAEAFTLYRKIYK